MTNPAACRLVRSTAAFALTLCVPLGAHASSSARNRAGPPVLTTAAASSRQVPVYRSSVTQHLLQLSVTDGSGRPVTNLGREAFALRENGEPRAIQTFLAPYETPLDVALVSDRSGSMDLGYDKAEEAAHGLLDRLGPDDCVRFSAFMDTPVTTGWMRADDPLLHEAIDTGWLGGSTGLYDAILESQVALAGRYSALALSGFSEMSSELGLLDLFRFERFYRELFDPARYRNEAGCVRPVGRPRPRQAILVITDGVDSASLAASKADVLRAAAFSRVPIFAASVRPPRPSNADEMAYAQSRTGIPTTDHVSGYLITGMGAVAESSGGDLVTLSTMAEAHRWLAERLDSFYVIGFESVPAAAEQRAGGGWNLVPGSLEVEVPGRDDLEVSFRQAIFDNATARTAAATEATLGGFSSLRQGATDVAVATFRHALSLDDGLAAAHFGLGRALVAKEELEPALRHLETARHFAPWASVVHASLARVQKALGFPADARKSEVRAAEAGDGRAAESIDVGASDPAAARPRLYLLVPTGADVANYENSRRLLAAIGRALLRTNSIGLAGTPDNATLALRLRFRADRRRRLIAEAVVYRRGGGNYDPIRLEFGNGDADALEEQGEQIVARVEALAGSPVPQR